MFNLEKQAIERQKVQNEVVELSLNYPNIVAEIATGVGKTKALLECINGSKSPLKWLILVPEIHLINNFLEDLKKHGYDNLLIDKIEEVICYASLHKYSGRKLNIGADEGHHSSPLRVDVLKSIKSDQRILLSATLSEEVNDRLGEICKWRTYLLSLKEAIERGILPELQVYLVYEELDDTDKCFSFKSKKGEIKLTAKDYYKKLDSNIEYWKERYLDKYESFAEKKWLFGAINRKRWIAKYKTNVLKNILKHIEGNRFICFTGSIEQAKKVGGKFAVHSKNPDSKQLIEDFNNLKSDKLFCINMLREGHNLSECGYGIQTQIDNNPLSLTQISGRLLRHSSPKLFIILLKDTVDIKYWNKVKDVFNSECIKELKL